MEFTCAKCNATLEKTTDLLVVGCSKCGSKVFKTITAITEKSAEMKTIPGILREKVEDYSVTKYEIIPKLIKEDEEERTRELEADNIPAIKLRKKGIYDVNLDSLFRDKKTDPIVLSGKQGIYRIEMIPPKEK